MVARGRDPDRSTPDRPSSPFSTWARTEARARSTAVLALVVAVSLIVPLAVVGVLVLPRNRGNEADLRRMRSELAYACPGEAVLDGRALAVFRPTALRYPSLVRGLRNWIEQGVIPSEVLVGDLRRARAPVGVFDSRLQIEGPVSAFIARHYVRQPDALLVAGAEMAVPRGRRGDGCGPAGAGAVRDRE